MAYTNKVPVAAAVATAVLFLAVTIAPQWTEAKRTKTTQNAEPVCALVIPEIVQNCYLTTSLLPSEECCKDLKTASKTEVTCLCENVIANPSNSNLTRALYDQVNIACGVLDKFACNGTYFNFFLFFFLFLLLWL